MGSFVVDAREEFVRDYVSPAIRANARYQGSYPLFTALGRPLLAKIACEVAREHGADTVAARLYPARATTRCASTPSSRRWHRS